jgi:tRNAThr (cytosine32-N3)-methyltransferase
MASSADAYAAARRLVDEAHAADPKGEELHYADGVERWAAALAARPFYAALAAAEAPELLALAARCQHLERFATPRDSFPEGKAGYLKWRRSLYVLQGDRARELLRQVGVAERECDAVRTWVSKTDLQPGKESGELGTQVSTSAGSGRASPWSSLAAVGNRTGTAYAQQCVAARGDKVLQEASVHTRTDAYEQLLEDAAVLVFLQEQLASFAAQHGEYPRRKFVDILRKTWRKLSPAGRDAVAGLDFPEALAGIIAEATEGETQGSAGGEPAAALPAAKEQTL